MHPMTQITVRNLPDSVEAKLRSLAEQSGRSLNQTIVQLLEAVTGGRTLNQPRRDLSGIAARWNASDADAFARATAVFESVDQEVWR